MYILSNALKNIVRNKGRNLLIAIIILVIVIAIVISIMINSATSEIIKDYKGRFGAEVTMDLDYEALAGNKLKTVSPLTPQQKIDFGKSPLLKKRLIQGSVHAVIKDIKAVDADKEDDMMGAPDVSPPNGRVIGSNRSDISDEFMSGQRKLAEGKLFQNKKDCLISRQLAKLNGLSVGDTINVQSSMRGKKEVYQFKIAGIYEDYTKAYVDEDEEGNVPYALAYNNRRNEIIVHFDALLSSGLFTAEDSDRSVVAKYTLKNPDDIDKYKKELKQKGLPDYYRVLTDESGYKNAVGPMEGMQKITNLFLIVILVLGIIILLIISTLNVRERKYEIGILRAIGMKKTKVARGLLYETLLITGICVVIGLSVGAVLSQPVANHLLENQIEIAKEARETGQTQQEGSVFTDFYTAGTPELEPLSNVSISLTPEAIAAIVMISLFIAVLSSISGILFITRFEPVKILSERN